MDPMGEVLYVSDTTSRRVYRVRNLGQPKDPSRNLEVVAGTGEQCLPFDQSHCGEGRKATEAALNNPRGRNICMSWNILYCKRHFWIFVTSHTKRSTVGRKQYWHCRGTRRSTDKISLKVTKITQNLSETFWASNFIPWMYILLKS